MRDRLRIAIGLVAVAAIAAFAVAFRVEERHASLVTRFGKPVNTPYLDRLKAMIESDLGSN